MSDGQTQLKRGTIIRGIGSFYTVKDQEGTTYTLRCKKKFRRQNMSPMTGDEIVFIPGESDQEGWIEEILPRKTVCLRPPVANISCLVIVLSPVPEPDLLLTDRIISRAVAQGMKVIIAVNKNDLDSELSEKIAKEYSPAGIQVFSVSALEKDGLDRLKKSLEGELCCFTGQSGAGKSTLLNSLFGIHLETGEVSRKILRGKNTTRQSELIEKDGFHVIDTAGFNLLEPEKQLAPENFRDRYPEFRPYEGKCRFRECLHDQEPGCAVEEAAGRGIIHPERLKRYRLLLNEIKEVWRTRYD